MNQKQCLADIHTILADALSDHDTVRILEAGGGSFSHIHIDNPSHITVIDISAEQLARNDYADEAVLGDLEDPAAIRQKHDLIVCFDVLEHLQHPDRALTHMVSALSDGGLIVIGCPNRASTKGLITRYTPHGFHVWYYQTIRGIADAGQPGHAPFETFLKPEMDFDRIQTQLKREGLEILAAHLYEGPAPEELAAKHPNLYRLYQLPAAFAALARLDRDRLNATDWIIVARRPARQVSIPVQQAKRA